MKGALASVFLLLGLSGCALPARQTEAFFNQDHPRRDLPQRTEVKNVPFIKQTVNHCGPATLTMAMQSLGRTITLDELSQKVYTPAKSGSMPMDLVSATRRQGLMGVEIHGLESLLHELADGHPVIVFENLALSWYPIWHFALVYGYDLNDRTVLMHSGSSAAKHWDMMKFERSWEPGDYWGLVVLPPGEIAKSAGELEHLAAAAGLEDAGHLEEADLSYRSILEKWPGSLGALIGLGNVAYRQQDFLGSAYILREATRLHPKSSAAWNNLAVAQKAANMPKAAEKFPEIFRQ
jgi:hypothetical protein